LELFLIPVTFVVGCLLLVVVSRFVQGKGK